MIENRRELHLSHKDLIVLAGDMLNSGHGFSLRARGQSMRPWIKDGDRLQILPVQPGEVRRGDVLLYRSTGHLLLAHRVIRVIKPTQGATLIFAFLLQGDAHGRPDGVVYANQVLGRVMHIERNARRIDVTSPFYRLFIGLWLLPGVRQIFRRLVP